MNRVSRAGFTVGRAEVSQHNGHAVAQRQFAVASLRGVIYEVRRMPAQLAQQEQRPRSQRLCRLHQPQAGR